MSELIKNGQILNDDWSVLRLGAEDSADSIALPPGRVLVPLAVWLARRESLLTLAAAGTVGVWLSGSDDPAALAGDLSQLQLIALDFPKFADGRSYSIATLLRTRYRYAGELRAIGEVLRDQFFYLHRCGFDSLQPPAGKYDTAQLEAALASLHTFAEPYQGAVDVAAPLFRRHARAPLTDKDSA
jgi:uncharacterized protein (DUF934 family)